jgi:DNA-binding NtrC family response regulator
MLAGRDGGGRTMMLDEWNELSFTLLPGDDPSQAVMELNSMISHLQMHAVIGKDDGGNAVLSIQYNDALWCDAKKRKAGRRPKLEPKKVTFGEARSMHYALGAKEAASRLGMPISTFYRKLSEMEYCNNDEPFSSF